MAATLSAPLTLRQHSYTASPGEQSRRWKRERTSYKISNAQTKPEGTRAKVDPSHVEAALAEWGVPLTRASRASPTCAVSWDESSVEASCSYLQEKFSSEPTNKQSLDRWDPSISFSPFSSSSLRTKRIVKDQTSEVNGYKSDSVRVLAIGREDGTVSVWRARGRLEDHVDLPSDSPDISFSSTNAASSTSSSAVSLVSRMRSPETEHHSINLSSVKRHTPTQLSPLLAHDRSFTSLATRSTSSTLSTQANDSATVNVHVEDSLPANSIETNVTATGVSARTDPENHDAEHALEAQMAAADRNDHQHGIVGGVIERLGLSHHHARVSGNHDSTSVSAQSSSVLPSRSSGSISGMLSSTQSGAKQTEATGRLPTSSAPNEWLKESGRGCFESRYTIATGDRSPVVSVRIVPISRQIRGSRKGGLLIVQEEGSVSLWSIDESVLLWETDLACQSLERSTGTKQEVVASAGFNQLSVKPSTPLSRSPVGSLRTKPSKVELSKAPKQPFTTSQTQEIAGVTLCSDVHTFRVQHKDYVALWDSLSCNMLFLDLLNGVLVAKELINDLCASCIPSILPGEDHSSSIYLCWISSSNKLQSRFLALAESYTRKENPATSSKDTSPTSLSDVNLTGVLPEDLSAVRMHFTPEKVLVLGGGVLRTFNLKEPHEQTFTPDVVEILGATCDSEQVLLRTRVGTLLLEPSKPDKHILQSFDQVQAAKMYLTWNTPSGQLLSKLLALDPSRSETEESDDSQVVVWDTSCQKMEDLDTTKVESSILACTQERVSAVLPLSLERIAVAVQGGIRVVSLTNLYVGSLTPAQPQPENSIGSEKDIGLLRLAVAPRSGTRYIMGATRQGDIAIWDATSLELLPSGSRCISTSPIEALLVFGDEDNTIRLHGCVACVSADSSVTMILLETFKTQYMIPGRGARLESLATRADELLLTYDDGKARVWDLRTQELRRSIAVDQAQALLDDGKGWWSNKQIHPYSPLYSGTTGVLSQLAAARDTFSASMLVDFRRAIEAASRSVRSSPVVTPGHPGLKSGPASEAQENVNDEDEPSTLTSSTLLNLASPAARKAISIIRPLLPIVFPLGLNGQIDKRFDVLLDLDIDDKRLSRASALSMGQHYSRSMMLLPSQLMQDPRRSWTLHRHLSTTRSLICCVLLRILAKVQELENLAVELTHFVEDELPKAVGQDFTELSLGQLSSSLLDSNEEVQLSSRALFKSAISRMDETCLETLCEAWQPLLPRVQNAELVTTEEACNALALLGNVAVERFKWMNPKLLKDVALSIGLMISSATSPESDDATNSKDQRRVGIAMAIDLCRAGFSIWQHYFDAAEIVRSLFALSTTGGSGSAEERQRSLARMATLQIAQDNTPLFMTTLSLDILHARSAAHCAATMRLVAFMVRKRPLVLLPNLPRLAEAVVKSLDPTMTEMREAVVNAATVMIGELVSTYPTIAFHGRGQRLAVGTHEGAVIMYDLKTATRLYVIEGHRQSLNGCSFSPDGRRLITLSLAERKLLVWKVGSGFTSFFTPGTIPRQGGTDPSGAYRSFDFNVGGSVPDSPSHTISEVLKAVQFEWHTNQRSVRVILGQAQLNISVD